MVDTSGDGARRWPSFFSRPPGARGARGRCVALVGERWMYTFEVTAMTTLLLLFAPTSTSPFIYFQF